MSRNINNYLSYSGNDGGYGNAPLREYKRVPRTMFEAYGHSAQLLPMPDKKAERAERRWMLVFAVSLVVLLASSCVFKIPHQP